MPINTNTWNILRYTIYTPIYDLVAAVFKSSRKKSIDSISINEGDKVLIVGAGTGLDLEFIPEGCEVIATDITPSMVNKIKRHPSKDRLQLKAVVMDGQALEFQDAYFDKVILHLILAVIPDPYTCIREVDRVLKPGGKVAVFDKFIQKEAELSLFRKFLNPLTNFLFSDITRDIYPIIHNTAFDVQTDVPANFNGNFRIVKLKK